MYYTEQDNSGSYSSSSNTNYYLDAEGQLTSAIQNVLSGSTTKMYVATGHSEVALPDTLHKGICQDECGDGRFRVIDCRKDSGRL